MRSRSRTRCVLKSAGTVAAALTLALWAVSIGAPGTVGTGHWYCAARAGYVTFWLHEIHATSDDVRGFEPIGAELIVMLRTDYATPCPWSLLDSYGFHLPWIERHVVTGFLPRSLPYFMTGVALPCWLLLILVAVPTIVLWYSDRRRIPPGHCQKCGYNLTGNISGRCPECGAPTIDPPKRAPGARSTRVAHDP